MSKREERARAVLRGLGDRIWKLSTEELVERATKTRTWRQRAPRLREVYVRRWRIKHPRGLLTQGELMVPEGRDFSELEVLWALISLIRPLSERSPAGPATIYLLSMVVKELGKWELGQRIWNEVIGDKKGALKLMAALHRKEEVRYPLAWDRARVTSYRLDWAVRGGLERRMGLAEARAALKQWQQSEWWQEQYPHDKPIRLRTWRFQWGSCNWERTEIRVLARQPVPLRRLLHELAHTITPWWVEPHGEEFVGNYVELVRQVAGEETAEMMLKEAARLGVPRCRSPHLEAGWPVPQTALSARAACLERELAQPGRQDRRPLLERQLLEVRERIAQAQREWPGGGAREFEMVERNRRLDFSVGEQLRTRRPQAQACSAGRLS